MSARCSAAPSIKVLAIRAALAPIAVRPFGRLLSSYLVNYLGDYAGLLALAVLVYAETGDALATAGLFIAAQFVPALLAPLLTARIDRGVPHRTLAALYLAEGLLFLALAGLSQAFFLPLVLVIVAVDGTLMLSARGITRAMVNGTLRARGLLREGNALINVAMAVAGVAGFALGGILVHASGVTAALVVDALSFFVIALLLLRAQRVDVAATPEAGVIARLRGGLGFVRREPQLRALLLGEGLAVLLFTLIVPIEVIYAQETLGTTSAGYGVLMATWSAGLVLGSLVFAATRRVRTTVLVIVSTALMGFAYCGMAAVDTLAAACAFSVLGGLGNGIQWVAVVTAVQQATPEGLQARVTGLLESVASAATGAGFLIGGVLTALTDPPTTFAAAGTGVLALAFAGAIALRLAARPRRRPAEPSGAA